MKGYDDVSYLSDLNISNLTRCWDDCLSGLRSHSRNSLLDASDRSPHAGWRKRMNTRLMSWARRQVDRSIRLNRRLFVWADEEGVHATVGAGHNKALGFFVMRMFYKNHIS